MESVAIIVTLVSVGGAFLAQAQIDYFREENRRLAMERRQLQEDLEEERDRVGRRDAELEDLDAELDARDEEVKELQEALTEANCKLKEINENYDALLGCGMITGLLIVVAMMIWAFMLGNSPLLTKCPGPAPYPLL